MKQNRQENKAPSASRCPVCNEPIPDNVSICPYCDEVIDKRLYTGYKQLFRTRTHWIVFVPWLSMTSVFIATVLFLERIIPWGPQMQVELLILYITATLLCTICVYETICRIILFITSSYVIMSNGINVNRAKFFGEITDDIESSHITAVRLESFNKKMNYGTIVIYTDDGKVRKLRTIKEPLEFKKAIDNLL